MIDKIRINVKSGKGGDGIISGRREKFVPHGGPDGGDGGNGGNVFVCSSSNLTTLLTLRNKVRISAEDGGHGRGGLKHGSKGSDSEIHVPIGTYIFGGNCEGTLIADLKSDNMRVLVAKGGKGGRGNARFSSPTNRFPLLAEAGEEGENATLSLELKLLADIGVVGLPNVGKSSLLSAVSAARPKVADYPFTTLDPVLGVVYRKDERLVMVDIPGLVEGAHAGVGLGDEFLRHVERTRVLIQMVDASSDTPIQQYHLINEELTRFSDELNKKPRIIAVNKIDIPKRREWMDKIRSDFSGEKVPLFFISAVTGEGLDSMIEAVFHLVQYSGSAQGKEIEGTGLENPRALQKGTQTERTRVKKDGDGWVLCSPAAARIAKMVDGRDPNAKAQFYAQLRRMGIAQALEDVGARNGDMVRIGKSHWTWE